MQGGYDEGFKFFQRLESEPPERRIRKRPEAYMAPGRSFVRLYRFISFQHYQAILGRKLRGKK